jgi:hypothetical protein
MSDPQQPKPAKFKGRLGSSVSQFGSQGTEMEPEMPETAKVLSGKGAKVQTTQEGKTVGRTIRFPPDLHRYLKAYAGLNGREVSDLVVEEMQRFRANHPLT